MNFCLKDHTTDCIQAHIHNQKYWTLSSILQELTHRLNNIILVKILFNSEHLEEFPIIILFKMMESIAAVWVDYYLV